MEDQKEKREREDNYIDESNSKKLCISTCDGFYKIQVKGKRVDKYGNYALCSEEDFDTLSKYSWSWCKAGYPYATVTETRKSTLMSRLVMKAEKGTIVDHINRDRKDNRRENLRFVTRSQNSQNKTKKEGSSSSYYGVFYYKNCKKFCAHFRINGMLHNIGYFDNEIDAAKAYDTYVTQNREKLGLCNPINFPDDIDIYKKSTLIELKKREPKSKFRYVVKNHNKFRASLKYEEKRIHLGQYNTAEEAAKIADAYIVQNNMDKKLNFPEEYPNFNPKLQKLYITEIDFSKPNTSDILKNIGKHAELADVDPNKDVLIQIGGNNKDKYTIIERSDHESMKYFNTSISKVGYVYLTKGRESHSLSRFIFRDTISKDEVVDHIFSNTLDNRKRFLKVTSVARNNNNKRKTSGLSSKFVGICASRNRYIIQITNNGNKFCKCMGDELEAARLRDIFIIQNYPNDNYRLNFNDWDDNTINHWTNQLKEHISWEKPIVEPK